MVRWTVFGFSLVVRWSCPCAGGCCLTAREQSSIQNTLTEPCSCSRACAVGYASWSFIRSCLMNFECCLAWSFCSAVAPPFHGLSLLKPSCNSFQVLYSWSWRRQTTAAAEADVVATPLKGSPPPDYAHWGPNRPASPQVAAAPPYHTQIWPLQARLCA